MRQKVRTAVMDEHTLHVVYFPPERRRRHRAAAPNWQYEVIFMELQRTESVEWVEVLSLQPTAHECRAYCLEPGETLFITLAAARPVDAALIDWETYKCWRVDGGGASIESRFAK